MVVVGDLFVIDFSSCSKVVLRQAAKVLLGSKAGTKVLYTM